MDPIVDLAPGAEQNPLAVFFADRIRVNLANKPHKIADFEALRASVQLVADDTCTSLTMRFDLGRLTVHNGLIGMPTVTFCGNQATLVGLTEVPLSRWLKLPRRPSRNTTGEANVSRIAKHVLRGDLKIYGLVSHPRLLLRLVRVISRHG